MDKRKELAQVIARNAKALLEKKSRDFPSVNALATAINTPVHRASANSIAYVFKPTKRPRGDKHADTLPRLDTLSLVAEKLGCDVWELLHPDIQALRRKLDVYETMARNFNTTDGAATHIAEPLPSRAGA